MSKYFNKNAKVFISWGIANTIGFVLFGLLLIYLVDHPVVWDVAIFGDILVVLITGLPLGLAQWFVFWRYFRVSPLWISSISLGLILLDFSTRMYLPDFIYNSITLEEGIVQDMIEFAITGAAIGFPQWVLVSDKMTQSWKWILASGLGMGLGIVLVDMLGLFVDSGAIIFILPLVYICTTGYVLITRMNNDPRIPQ